jgi:hypothetical protein
MHILHDHEKQWYVDGNVNFSSYGVARRYTNYENVKIKKSLRPFTFSFGSKRCDEFVSSAVPKFSLLEVFKFYIVPEVIISKRI